MSGESPEKDLNSAGSIRFGDFVYAVETGELLDETGHPVHLRHQSSEVLAFLVDRMGETVSKDDLFDNVWARKAVTDDSLSQCIADIRRALNDADHKIVQTIPKKGYRLVPTSSSGEVPPTAWLSKVARMGGPRIAVFGLIAAVALVFVAFWGLGREQHASSEDLPLPSKPSIAVLAFEDLSVGPDANYLSDAIAEGIIVDLSRYSELFVIARNSSFSFRDSTTDVSKISRALGVRYLLEGSQQKSGSQLRVTVQLIDAIEGRSLWSHVYNSDLGDVFAMQDEIVQRTVATVAQRVINFEGQKAIRSDEAKLTALLLHWKARQHLFSFTPEGNEKARLSNLAAIEADPTQPYGYVGLTFVHINRYRWGWTDEDLIVELDAARRYARKAVQVAPEYYDAHTAMAYMHIQEGELGKSVARFRKALDLNPNDTSAMAALAEALTYGGRAEEAEDLMLRVVRLDPLHQDWIKWNLAWVQWHTRNCDDALETMNGMSEIPPMAYRVLAIIQMCRGNKDEARKAVEQLISFDPEYSLQDVLHNYEGKYVIDADLERVLNDLREAGLPE
ncbi:winged helix-turn-helix domain-containing protein [Aliiroseovarius sp. F47248L]|uniref:winged helix-turn-helix domain-containing tetratricopeptide repeat protein n=1 Tax=Aliiroseovarius sp. F47248L TaxID=2926420 RepID=UPI001FF2153E|nr:winged helix-turn-helix domain-containing protein [Aliiroseovarius sp. F47248L]MCK0138487.1 winged helix-turn-helix domain-containing protein [Aliiroseovarius sp. F47248L]